MITIAAFRSAIASSAAKAAQDAPADADLRLAAFVARLSGSMESLGDHELDAMLLGLLDQVPAEQRAMSPNPVAMPSRARVWG